MMIDRMINVDFDDNKRLTNYFFQKDPKVISEYLENRMEDLLENIIQFKKLKVDNKVASKLGEKELTSYLLLFGAPEFLMKYYPDVIYEADFESIHWVITLMENISYLGKDDSYELLSKNSLEDIISIITNSMCQSTKYFSFERNIQNPIFIKQVEENEFYSGREGVIRDAHEIVGFKPKEENVILTLLYKNSEKPLSELHSDLMYKIEKTVSAVTCDFPDKEYNVKLLNNLQLLCENIFENRYIISDNMDFLDVTPVHVSKNKVPGARANDNLLVELLLSNDNVYLAYMNMRYDSQSIDKRNYFLKLIVMNFNLITYFSKRCKTDSKTDSKTDNKTFMHDYLDYAKISSMSEEQLIQDIVTKAKDIFEQMSIEIKDISNQLRSFFDGLDDVLCETIFHEGKKTLEQFNGDEIKLMFLPKNYKALYLASTIKWFNKSLKYNIREGNDVQESYYSIERVLKPLKHTVNVMYWNIIFYRCILDGHGSDQLKNNQSYRSMVYGEDIGATEKKNYIDELPSDMDFKPYQDALDYYNAWWTAYNYLDDIYRKKASLGQCLEWCYWVNYFITSSNNESLYDHDLDSIIAKFQNYIYGNVTTYKVKKVIEKMKNKITLTEIEHRFKIMFEDMIKQFTNVNQLAAFMEQKRNLIAQSNTYGYIDEADSFSEYCFSLMKDRLEELVSQTKEYRLRVQEIEDKLELFKQKINNSMQYLYNDVSYKADEIIDKLSKLLATGEELYRIFVDSDNNVVLTDYGCIAIEYYRSLEYLANQLIYKPYYNNVLMGLSNLDKNVEEQAGRCGNSFNYITYGNQNNKRYRETLEYGTLAKFIADMDTTSKYQKVKLFYEAHDINIKKLKQFALKMKQTIDLRNQCAHPDIHNKSFAIKARNVTYKHSIDDETLISPIKIAIDIYELIFAIGDIFE